MRAAGPERNTGLGSLVLTELNDRHDEAGTTTVTLVSQGILQQQSLR